MSPLRVIILRGGNPVSNLSHTIVANFQIGPSKISMFNIDKGKVRNVKGDLIVLLPELDFHLSVRAINDVRRVNGRVSLVVFRPENKIGFKTQMFDAGVDDYFEVPVDFGEMNLRLRALLRRSRISVEDRLAKYTAPGIVFDYSRLIVSISGGIESKITRRCGDLLRFFWEHPNILLPRSTVLESVWGYDNYFLGRSMDVLIHQLRKILSRSTVSIETVHGHGFIFNTKKTR